MRNVHTFISAANERHLKYTKKKNTARMHDSIKIRMCDELHITHMARDRHRHHRHQALIAPKNHSLEYVLIIVRFCFRQPDIFIYCFFFRFSIIFHV